ncbi:MAG: beta-ketoacyl synthase N-terminal-like domain-containing protein [Candidatus Omnitrophica bacterium]|nr:beta-ketoacyl synthase N-terminal-like domain-containing protein [Candidatus Omnitrophota bacterium]
MIKDSNRRIVITGMGPICSLGMGCGDVWSSVLNARINLVKEAYLIGGEKWGEFYLHKMRDFNIDKFGLPDKNFKFIKELRTIKREDVDLYYLLAAVRLAIKDSDLKYEADHNDIGLVISHENPGVETLFEELTDLVYGMLEKSKNKKFSKLEMAQTLYFGGCEERGYNLQTFSYLYSVAKVFDIHGYSLFINNACASGLFAIESAARQIKSGVSPVVIVAAVDNPTKIYKYLWFKKHNLYAEDGICRPFSNDANGTVFGDGGAALILEDLEHARNRGAKIYGEYLGGGFSLEGWKIVVPNITDDFYVRSFQKALEVSGIVPKDIDFINPHGVGLKVTDIYEANTINAIFKDKKPLISAFKPLVGHNLGGSALLESAITLLGLKNNFIPATLNCENENKKLNLKVVTENQKTDIGIAAKMSCGFAGFSGVCIFKKMR